ncbi:hypothetical protein [Okeania sp. SIO2C2]|uniref:hypothetical protein n=1 Tax=Okeania sp. SIO2C2 TaxID=2607787 RepID=UPI00338FBA1D
MRPNPACLAIIPPSRYPNNTGCRSSYASSPPVAAAVRTNTKSMINRKSSCTDFY